ncbi:MAG: FtsQ-type POTRA domain-containing protein [Acidobacteria bacterium]|nr:FtsQ-type POTRA domain-containing protein [Acidobacteriota bacterium]
MAMNHELEEQQLIRKQRKRDIRRKRDSRPVWRMFLGWCGRALLTLLLTGVAVALLTFVSSSAVFNLARVEVLGNQHLHVEEIRHVLMHEFPRNLVRVRLSKVREFVESHPWVRSCQVRRVFPGTLKILVVERRPVALAKIENELFLVDEAGVVLESYGSGFQHLNLPVVRGLENSTQENVTAANQVKMDAVMRVLAELDSGPEPLSEGISEIDVTEPGRVALVPLDQPIRVFVGDSKYRERYQTYLSKLSLMADLAAQYGAMDSVDLSIDHRIIFHTKRGDQPRITVKADQSG